MQIDNTFFQFRNVTLTRFSRSFKLIRDIMNGNAFISSRSLNWEWWTRLDNFSTTILTRPIIKNKRCSCGTQSDCFESGGVYDGQTDEQIFAIPGWNVGCSAVETLLHSTLECFYDQNCIDSLLFHIPNDDFQSPRVNFSAINSSRESRFDRNTSIQNIVDQLFIEEWKWNSSYLSFYNQCAPISCSYQIRRNDHFMHTVSQLLGLYGGLTTSLRFTIPLIVKTIFKIRNRFRRNTVISME
ncbi:unnamed protein product [Adineta ricciae]|uniref:Uncharacterized protein n=1 Tax=Adineta ricciae TaxID=249248 RepID=A0A813WNA4_ADIRI|nr:unnamed protein product [Adineta ricciae]CAF1430723.1 unnamed protein product [Adineta ricciae]